MGPGSFQNSLESSITPWKLDVPRDDPKETPAGEFVLMPCTTPAHGTCRHQGLCWFGTGGFEKPDGEEILRHLREECEGPVPGARDSCASSSCAEVNPKHILAQAKRAGAD